ncbi:MAG: hypothetical protein J5980_04515 [Muribaculaceae bacterium]|nr:hypothetical protein [Muribaculaceae bacterium]
MVPTIIDKSLSYMPWGGDNMMPYNILKLIEDDETLSTCQQFNAKVCYGSGLKYNMPPLAQWQSSEERVTSSEKFWPWDRKDTHAIFLFFADLRWQSIFASLIAYH